MLRHWKIKDEANGKCYFVCMHPNENSLEAVGLAAEKYGIARDNLRIIEKGGQTGHTDLRWHDFVKRQLNLN